MQTTRSSASGRFASRLARQLYVALKQPHRELRGGAPDQYRYDPTSSGTSSLSECDVLLGYIELPRLTTAQRPSRQRILEPQTNTRTPTADG